MAEHTEHGSLDRTRWGTWGTVDDTTWAVPIDAEWVLRYGTPEQVNAWRMGIAWLVNCYAALVDPSISQRDAIAKLRSARAVAREVPS